MTNQEIFDKAIAHAFKQKDKALNTSNTEYKDCRYRTSEGKKCLVGCLIKDGYYDPAFEGTGVSDPFIKEVLQKSGINCFNNPDTMELLLSLQSMHDRDDTEYSMYACNLPDISSMVSKFGLKIKFKKSEVPDWLKQKSMEWEHYESLFLPG